MERVGTTDVAGGLWTDGKGRFWVTSPEDDNVKQRMPGGTLRTTIQNPRLRWPDPMVEGTDGTVCVMTSRIQDVGRWHNKGSSRTEAYALWKLTA